MVFLGGPLNSFLQVTLAVAHELICANVMSVAGVAGRNCYFQIVIYDLCFHLSSCMSNSIVEYV